ncbi:MAG: discoidin domain-containing protein [Bacteroides sp.]|nr:discoidin domain-containing protein [Bacteroides sp.]MCI1682601.1 discoidin domain-containing protein [Bacteroides sp.]
MKTNISYLLTIIVFIVMGSCDSKLEPFETDGYKGTPVTIDPQWVKGEALPGQILLTWEVPKKDYSYLQIEYYDPLTKEIKYKIASTETTQMLIDDTRARFGDYIFNFQTFNANHQGGVISEVKAQSGAAPATITVKNKTKVNLIADQLSTNAQEPTEGPIKNLVDGNSGTFFHTRWSSPQLPLPHWIEVKLNEPHENFMIYYMNRTDNTWATSGRPATVELQIGNDGETWEKVATLSGLPSAHSSEYWSNYVTPGKTFTYFRFYVTATTGNTQYFNLAEFAFYDVELDIYDPETVPLD